MTTRVLFLPKTPSMQLKRNARTRTGQRPRQHHTLEWMVVIGILFAAAVWAATKIVSTIHTHANQIK
jgi:hypothetical protein